MLLGIWGTLFVVGGLIFFWLAVDGHRLRWLFYAIGVVCWLIGVVLWSGM